LNDLQKGIPGALESCLNISKRYVEAAHGAVSSSSSESHLEEMKQAAGEVSSYAIVAWLAVSDDASARGAQEAENLAILMRELQAKASAKVLNNAEATQAWVRPQVSATWDYVAMQLRKRGKTGPAEVATRIGEAVRSGAMGGTEHAQMFSAVESVAIELRGRGEVEQSMLEQVMQGMTSLQEAEISLHNAEASDEESKNLREAHVSASTRLEATLEQGITSLTAAIAGMQAEQLPDTVLIEALLGVAKQAQEGIAPGIELQAGLFSEEGS